MLLSCIQITIVHKVQAHTNIHSNELADKLTKANHKLHHGNAEHAYEYAHSTLYYFQKNWCYSMDQTPNKCPIQFLEKCIIKYDKKQTLYILTTNFSNMDK